MLPAVFCESDVKYIIFMATVDYIKSIFELWFIVQKKVKYSIFLVLMFF